MHSENDRELSYQLSNINRLYMSLSPEVLSLSLPERALFLRKGGGGGEYDYGLIVCKMLFERSLIERHKTK